MHGDELSVPMLRTSCEESRTAVRFSVAGEIDIATAGRLDDGLRKAIGLASADRPLTVDLHDVTFLGAAGLRVLVAAQAACDGRRIRMLVAADHAAVLRPITVSGLAESLTLVPR